MNINAKELLMLDKAKYARMNNQPVPTTTSTETPVTNPNSGMKALEIQANNNIAFQGGMTKVAQKSVKKLAPMLAAGLFAALASQSCIKMDQYMEADFSAITELFSQMMDQMKDSDEKIIAMLQKLYDQAVANGESDKAFQETVLDYMQNDKYAQEKILEALKANGMSQAEANAWLEKIFEEVANGNKSIEQALSEIFGVLGSIDDTVKDIYDEVVIISDKITNFHEDYLEGKEELLGKFDELIEVEKDNGDKISINGEKLDELIGINQGMAEDIDAIRQGVNKLIKIAKDPTRFNEMMEAIRDNKFDEEEMAQLDVMFKTLGLDITEVVEKSTEDLKGAMGDVQGAVENFNKDYLTVEAEQTKLQGDILAKLGVISKKMDQLSDNQKAELALLKEKFASLENIGEDAVEELRDIDAALDGIQATLNIILDTVLGISEKITKFNEDYLAGKDELVGKFNEVIEVNKYNGSLISINGTKLDALIEVNKGMAEDIDNIEHETYELLQIAKDPTKFEELMAAIKDNKLDAEEMAQLDVMFKTLGLDITEVVEKSTKNLQGSMKDVQGAVENFNNDYLTVEAEQTELSKAILEKLGVLSGKMNTLSDNQKAEIALLKEQFEALKEAVNKNGGDITAELRDIDAALDGIQATLNIILDTVLGISEKITKFNEDYLAGKDELVGKFNEVIEVNKYNGSLISINGTKLDALIEVNKGMAEDIDNIEHETYELLQIAKDPTKFEELMAAIKDNKLDAEEMAQLDVMFKTLGLDITEVVEKSTKNLQGSMKDVQGAVENFNNDYLTVEAEQTELSKAILEKLGVLSGKMNTLSDNQKAEIALLKEQFEALKEAVNKNGGDITAELRDIDAALDGIQATLNFIYEEILSIGDDVEALKNGQDVIISQFGTVIKNGQIQIAQLDKVNAQLEKSNATLANVEQNTKDMIAIAKDPTRHNELIATIKDLKFGDEEYARFEAMFKTLGLTLSDVVKMSGSQLEAAIKEFQNTYIATEKEKLAVEQEVSRKLSVLSGQLSDMSASQKSALAKVEAQFNALRNANNANAKEILAELKGIDAALDGIQATLNVLVEKVGQIGEDVAALKNSKESTVEILNKMFENDKVQTNYLYLLLKGQNEMAANVQKIENNTYATLDQVKNNHAEFIEALKNLQVGTPDYTEMQNALKAMGISIEQAIKMNADQLEAALKTFLDTYVATEKEQTIMMGDIYDAIQNNIAQYPGVDFDTTAIEEAIAGLTDAVKAGNADVTLLVKLVLQELNELNDVVNAIYKELGSLATTTNAWMNKFDNKFDDAVDAIIANMGANTDKIVEQQKYTNSYMASLNAKADEMIAALEDLANKTAEGSNITIEQLEELWVERDEANYAKYSKLIKDLGVNLPSTAKLEELVGQINDKLDLRKDYTEQINQIIDLLIANNAELAGNAEKVAEIKAILENMKLTFNFNIDCPCGDESYTGDDYSKVEDLFGNP